MFLFSAAELFMTGENLFDQIFPPFSYFKLESSPRTVFGLQTIEKPKTEIN